MFEARDFFLRMLASNTCSFTCILVKRYFIYEAAPLRSANSDAASDASADPSSQVVAAAGLAAAAAVASVRPERRWRMLPSYDHFLPSCVVCGRRAYASSKTSLGLFSCPFFVEEDDSWIFVVDPQLVEVPALRRPRKSWQSRSKPGDRATAVTHRRWTAHCYHGCHGSAGCVAVCHTCQHPCQHLRHFSSNTVHNTDWFIPGSLYWLNQVFFHCSIESHSTCFLVGGFNPSEKY